MPLTVFDIKGIPAIRRERIEAAVHHRGFSFSELVASRFATSIIVERSARDQPSAWEPLSWSRNDIPKYR